METNVKYLHGPDFWRQAWNEARMSSPCVKRIIRTEEEARQETVDYWNRFAPVYGMHSVEQEKQRVAKIINFLEREKLLTPETELLDIGCGPGNYSLPLAGRVRSVTALDGAGEMCRILKQGAEEAKLSNVNVLEQMWEDVDLEEAGMLHKFDLVFASMTPAVCNYETLLKMIHASRKYCCLIWWAGWTCYQDLLVQGLWERFFQEKEDYRGFVDIIYHYNLLYSMGYDPSMQLEKGFEWVEEETVEQAAERLSRFFWMYMDINSEVKDTIFKYVQEQAEDGILRQKTRYCLGIITWRVDK